MRRRGGVAERPAELLDAEVQAGVEVDERLPPDELPDLLPADAQPGPIAVLDERRRGPSRFAAAARMLVVLDGDQARVLDSGEFTIENTTPDGQRDTLVIDGAAIDRSVVIDGIRVKGTVTGARSSAAVLIDNGNLLKKLVFPRINLPLIVAGVALINNLLLLLATIVVLAILGHSPSIYFLWVPALILLTLSLGLGVGLVVLLCLYFAPDEVASVITSLSGVF